MVMPMIAGPSVRAAGGLVLAFWLAACAASPRSAPPAGPLTVHVESFVMRGDDAAYAWIAPSTRSVLRREWGERYRLLDGASGADCSVLGEYWVRDHRLIIAAAVHRGLRVVERRQWEAPADREDLVIGALRQAAADLESDFRR